MLDAQKGIDEMQFSTKHWRQGGQLPFAGSEKKPRPTSKTVMNME